MRARTSPSGRTSFRYEDSPSGARTTVSRWWHRAIRPSTHGGPGTGRARGRGTRRFRAGGGATRLGSRLIRRGSRVHGSALRPLSRELVSVLQPGRRNPGFRDRSGFQARRRSSAPLASLDPQPGRDLRRRGHSRRGDSSRHFLHLPARLARPGGWILRAPAQRGELRGLRRALLVPGRRGDRARDRALSRRTSRTNWNAPPP